MNEHPIVDAFLTEYDEGAYPADFLACYDRLECLANNHRTETFLVIEKGGEARHVAKCYDKAVNAIINENAILKGLKHNGIPLYKETFENDAMAVVVREYIEGSPLDRYVSEQKPDNGQIVKLCSELADILIYLHAHTPPIIHRDIKPQNIIVKPDGHIALIDFDISRVYRDEAERDTQLFGTREYASPEQYGFSQTDCRADIYSFGVLLRFLLTGSTKEIKNIAFYKPLMRVVQRCTAFAPKERYPNMVAVKKALLAANPKTQLIRKALFAACVIAVCALLSFGGVKLYQYLNYTPFSSGAIPAVLSDEERVTDAIAYMKEKYNTSLFDSPDKLATMGLLRQALVEVYGLDQSYVYALPGEGIPHEDEKVFMPWGLEDGQNLDRDLIVYAAVKLHSTKIISDYSRLKDDNGYYPGVRVAVAFAEENGILSGVNRPEDSTIGDMALIFANSDRVFDAAQTEKRK